MQATIKTQQTQVDQLTKSIQNRDSGAAKATQGVRKAASKVKTPQQAAAAIPDVSGVPVTFRVLPDLGYEVSGPDLTAIYKAFAICKEHDLMLAQCQGDYADLQKKAGLLEQQRNIAVQTVRGGTFWHRFVSNSKWVLYGAGIGAGAYAVVRH